MSLTTLSEVPADAQPAQSEAQIEADIVRYRRRRSPKYRPKKRQSPAGLTSEEAHTKLVVVGAARAEIARHDTAVSSLNREATALAETLVGDDRPWATDEPFPDLSCLGNVSHGVGYDTERRPFLAWIGRQEDNPSIDPRAIYRTHPRSERTA